MSYFYPKNPNPSLSYRSSTNCSIIKAVKVIAPTVDASNNIIRDVLDWGLAKADDNYLKSYTKFSNKALLRTSKFLNLSPVGFESRPTPGNEPGTCYESAYDEWKKTGNEPLIVWEACHGLNYVYITPHAVNRDKVTGVLYETIDRGDATPFKELTPCWILKHEEATKKWLSKLLWKPDAEGYLVDTLGNLLFIKHNNKGYVVRTKYMDKHTSEEKEFKHIDTFDI